MNRILLCLMFVCAGFTAGPTHCASADPLDAATFTLTANETSALFLREIFPGFAFPVREISSPKNWTVTANGETLSMRAAQEHSSMELIEVVDLEGRTVYLPVYVKRVPLHIFRYRAPDGDTPPGRVSVTGSFIGWNSDGISMTDADNDRAYEASVRLEPDTYFYKLIIDGAWMTDPVNPNVTEDSYKHSVIATGFSAPVPKIVFTSISEFREEESGPVVELDVKFQVTGEGSVDTASLLALVDGRPIDLDNFYFAPPYLTATVSPAYQTLKIEALTPEGIRLEPVFIDRRPKISAPGDTSR